MRSWITAIGAIGVLGCGGAASAPDATRATDAGDAGIDAPPGDAGPDAGGLPDAGGPLFAERWDGTATGWPGWTALGGVASAHIVAGLGGFTPSVSAYSLGRMGHALPAAAALDASYTVRFSDIAHQGAGLYLRQNGGYLGQTTPHGAGYAAFLEGFQGPRLGVWREQDGVEIELLHVTVAPLTNGTAYRVRFQVAPATPTSTALAAKVWRDGDPEPAAWTVTATDGQADLQGATGGVALDAWSTATPQNGQTPTQLTVDDLVVTALP